MPTATKSGLFVLLSAAAFGQSTPNVTDILKKVSETYKSVSQYEFIADASTQATLNHVLFAFKAPNQYRMEGTLPGSKDFSEVVIVHDGSTAWFYMPKSNQYGSFPASLLTADAPGDLGDLNPKAMDYYFMRRYRGAIDFVSDAKVLREETIAVSGVKVECFVVSLSGRAVGGNYTWWIDKKDYRVLREDHNDNSSVFTTIKLGEALPEDLFRFAPPAGAKKIEPQQ